MNDFKIISWDEITKSTGCFFPEGSAVTIGGFDGPHRGHRELFSRILNNPEKDRLTPGIITFFKPPSAVKDRYSYGGDVSTLRLRLKRFREAGFKFVILIDFSASFAKIHGTAFFELLKETVGLKYLAVGSDFCCGYRRELDTGSLQTLAPRLGFEFEAVGSVNASGGERISSTAIRKAVGMGDFARAKELLGFPFLLDVAECERVLQTNGTVCMPRRFLTQILPPAGAYTVFLTSFDGAKEETSFFVHDKDVRIKLKKRAAFNMEDINTFDTIEFIGKE